MLPRGQPARSRAHGAAAPDPGVRAGSAAIDGQTYFVLDLPRPICLDRGADGRTENVRSVHVFALDSAGRRQLRRYAERRVTITFRQVFGELTAHHLRPIVGEVARTALAR
ncbi:MAG: hypothetical protein JO048_18240 [Methylobacteriaceae bacterium]|nr:hypothetical protein [Methylobacteriaceae bacterium]